MGNALIYVSDQFEKLIVSRRYGCLYLPLYYPGPNPIEQSQFVVKSREKREKLLKEDTLTSKIVDACNSVYLKIL